MKFPCGVHLVLIFGLINTDASRLIIKDSGYDGIVVAVNKDVPYSPRLVERTKSLIQDASNKLYEAVGLYIRRASILVPSTWSREQTWEKTTRLTFDESDLRVDKPHPYYRNRPYTHPTWQCGKMQTYIHVTPEFLSDTQNNLKNKDTLLANQFGTYLFGVFDDIVKKKNASALSKVQERVCGGRSVWEVVRAHPDHQESGHPLVDTVFTVMYNENDQNRKQADKNCGRPVVILLDFSGSMNYHNRLLRQEQVGSKFIKEILPLNSQLGIIGFASDTETLASLQTLSSNDDKEKLITKLSKKELQGKIGQLTGIGAALRDAFTMLQQLGQPLEECRIVLLTDGEENRMPYIREVVPEIVMSKVKVHAIAVGNEGDEQLGDVATKTGGLLGQYFDGEGSSTLNQVVNNLWSDFNMQCVEPKPIEIENRAFKLDKDHTAIEEIVTIDSDIEDPVFTFTPETDDIEVLVSAPDQTTYDKQSLEYTKEQLNVIRFTFKNSQSGEWKTKVISKSVTSLLGDHGGQHVIMNVKAKAREETKTFEVRSWVSSVIVQIPAVTHIYAEVTKDYAPLIKANVTATVGTPEGAVQVNLKDDGRPPDVRALDGTYTGEFTRSTKDGHTGPASPPVSERYSVDITVTPVEGETQVVQELTTDEQTDSTDSLYDMEIQEDDIVAKAVVEMFKRKGTPGAIEVKNITAGVDQYPPNRVEDLSLAVEAGTVTLVWTAPGDDWREGTASEYEIRFWHNATELRLNFSTGVPVQPEMVVSGSLKPSKAGSREMFMFKLPEHWWHPQVFVAIVSRDEASHQSELSILAQGATEGPAYSILDDPVAFFIFLYSTVYFVTRLIEMTTLKIVLSRH